MTGTVPAGAWFRTGQTEGVAGVRRTFSRAELESFRDAVVPDLLPTAPDHELKLLFVGINPGLWTAATQTHFAYPGNRFYPALLRAGVIVEPVDPAAGLTEDERDVLRARGIGITNLVARATAKASELGNAELKAGGAALVALVERLRPRVVAVAGITAYRAAFGLPKATMGRQPEGLGRRRAVGGAEPERAQRARDRGDAGDGVRRCGPRRRHRRQACGELSDPLARSSAASQGGGMTDDLITSQADLEQVWRRLMEPLGFTRTSLWIVFVHPDGRPHKTLIEVPAPDSMVAPDPTAPELLDLLHEWTTGPVPDGRVAFLRTRPGRGGLDRSDRLWAAALYAAARVAGVPCEVVHAANDDRLVPVPLDEIDALSA